ncbi:hypothetical protein Nepgr_023412 [Nepenthes gracilis]|uniref:Uncharacterized protein n=1 Tax=Nepenthes gracilis TaxID=150966 RepID=A0AAD3XZ32_NEPGR|nr:hypothetical protein Nepgr_023412 [Nepenthes gracilis]
MGFGRAMVSFEFGLHDKRFWRRLGAVDDAIDDGSREVKVDIISDVTWSFANHLHESCNYGVLSSVTMCPVFEVRRRDSSSNSSTSEDKAALKRLGRAVSSSLRRDLTLSESSSQSPGVIALAADDVPLVLFVPVAKDQGTNAEVLPILVVTLAQFGVPMVAYSSDEESISGLPVGFAVEVPHEDWLVEAPVELAGEGNEAKGAGEDAETAAGVLEVVTKIGEVGLATGVAEVVEIVDASRVGSLEFEDTGTTIAVGPVKELSLGPSMPVVVEGGGEGDVVTSEPSSVAELRIFPDPSRLGEMLFLEEDLIRQRDEELFHRDQTQVNSSVLEEMEGQLNNALAEDRGSQEEVVSLRLELFVLREERSRALDDNALVKNELQVAIWHLSEF